jgi:hypothetical protein
MWIALKYRPLSMPLAFTALAGVAGAVAYRSPVLGLGIGAGVLALGIGSADRRLIFRLLASALVVILTGYAFIGRPFAYLGVQPIFVGEAVLGLGLLALALNVDRWRAFRHPTAWLLLIFGAWGAFRTLPYVSSYGTDALRDAVVWGYAIFAILLVPFISRSHLLEQIPATFGRIAPWFLLWVPVALVARILMPGAIPTIPGTEISLLALKAGDLGVHLGGVAAFLLLRRSAPDERATIGKEWLLWTLWAAGFLMASSINRGGMLAALAAIGVAILMRPAASLRRVGRAGIAVGGLLLVLVLFDVSIEREGGRRALSPQQVMANAGSIFGDSARGSGLSGTREWRMTWWTKIVDYTVHGPYFWTGKGFGINLAMDDGMETGNRRNRNPHNGHLTILARTGVPGASLWVLLQVAFAASMIRGFVRARRAGLAASAAVFVWILAYWLAFLVNMSFDVFLEGPQGGIWFWCLFGVGIAATLTLTPPRADANGRAASYLDRVRSS